DTSSCNNKLEKEVDGSIANEIQNLTVSQIGDTLYLSQSNWVLIPGISEKNHPPAPKPIIQNITINKTSVAGGTNVILTIYVDDLNYPNTVDWINLSFNGPSGNIYDEGSSVTYTDYAGVWEYSRTDFIADSEPSGDYYYTDIFVKNESINVESHVWSG
ncbi:MAG: hypothetical protein RLO12_12070, partial [Fulvivirga sp.]